MKPQMIKSLFIPNLGEIMPRKILPELVSGRGTATRSGVVEGYGALSAATRRPLRQRFALPPPRDKLGEDLKGKFCA